MYFSYTIENVSICCNQLPHVRVVSSYLCFFKAQSNSASLSSVRKCGPHHKLLTAAAQLVSRALAGVIAPTASYPLEVIQQRAQVSGAAHKTCEPGVAEMARIVHRNYKFHGFYVGLTIAYTKVVPILATSSFIYERMMQYLGLCGNW